MDRDGDDFYTVHWELKKAYVEDLLYNDDGVMAPTNPNLCWPRPSSHIELVVQACQPFVVALLAAFASGQLSCAAKYQTLDQVMQHWDLSFAISMLARLYEAHQCCSILAISSQSG